MRCTKHLSDRSSGVGVCASCLRESLSTLTGDNSPPLSATVDSPQKLFFHTGPSIEASSSGAAGGNNRSSKEKKTVGLSRLSQLFRSRSGGIMPKITLPHSQGGESSSSTSVFTTIFSPRRKNNSSSNSKPFSDEVVAKERHSRRETTRGMSPERGSDLDSNSVADSGRQKKPVTPRRSRHRKTVSAMAICLNPLVRASPGRSWNQKGGLNPDMLNSCEIRTPAKAHLSTASSSNGGNRSRKLADFGKVNHNR